MMKSFKDFLLELYNVPVIAPEKTQVDINDEDTINEVNKNLSIALSMDFTNVSAGINAARKVLSLYGIEIPQTDLLDRSGGKISVPISQYRSSGESHFDVTGPFQEKNDKHIFEFLFKLENGSYDCSALIKKIK